MAITALKAVGGTAGTVATLLDADGSARHAHLAALRAGGDAVTLADAMHFLCLVHGRFPGVMDRAADRIHDQRARAWMFRAAAGFATERAYLARLAVAAGPIPRRVRQAQAETAVTGQAHAFSVLAQSERRGTALGAAFALALDWPAIRGVLDAGASRFALTPPPCDLPAADETLDLAVALGESVAVARAIAFGAQQLLIQHRALWDLLETRAGLPG